MPIYEYECGNGHRWEELRPIRAYNGVSICPIGACRFTGEMVPSLCAMRPDPYWSGIMTENYGYVTSSSQVAQIRKDRHLVEVGDRTEREAMKKRADDAAKSKREQFAKETRAFVEEEFSGKGMIDSFGELTPEANRPLSDKPITDTKDERLKP